MLYKKHLNKMNFTLTWHDIGHGVSERECINQISMVTNYLNCYCLIYSIYHVPVVIQLSTTVPV